MKYEPHSIAEILPLLADVELHDLAADIKKNGLRNPITLHEGKVLDGRNRLAACEIAGVEPRFTTFDGESAVAFVVSQNVRRRHLTPSQKAMVAVQMEPHFAVEAKARRGKPRSGPIGPDRSRDEAAAAVGASGRSVGRAKRVLEEGGEEIAMAVQKGEISLNKAERIVTERPSASTPEADRAARMYADGVPVGMICEQTGLSKDQLDRVRKTHGLERGRGNGQRGSNPIGGATKEIQGSADFLESVLSQGGIRGLTGASNDQITALIDELERLIQRARKVLNTLKRAGGSGNEVREDQA